jgi:uncharacterized membrane protein YgcG
MLPNLVNNVQATAPQQPNTSLLQSLITAALAQKGIDPTTMTGAAQLATLLQNTQTTGNAARADQLKANTDLTSQAITTLGNIVTGGGSGSKGGSGGSGGSGSSGGSGGSGNSGGSGGSSGNDILSAVLPLIIAALA